MNLSKAAIRILNKLADLVKQIQASDFIRPSETLSGSTIGQHIRHTLEFIICFEDGFEEGNINYDKRSHDKKIETDKTLCLDFIYRSIRFVHALQENRPLKLELGYDPVGKVSVTGDTNAARELVYNIEHAVTKWP